MNSASSAFCASAGTISMPSPPPHGLVRRDVERVAQLVRDDDRAHVLQVAQLDDLLVHGDGRDRIEAGRRLVVEQDAAAWPPSRARSPRGAAGRPTAPTASRSMNSRRPTKPSTSSTRASTCRAACRSPRTACSRRSRHGQRVEQRALLEHHPEVGAHLHQLQLGHRVDALAVHPDRAGVGLQQAENQLQDRRLARAARAEDDLRVPRQQREADVLQHHLVVERQRHVVEHDDRLLRRSRVVSVATLECRDRSLLWL